ncbi:MAG: proteasome accessory factor PafA2 family protein [Chthoniobacteraceae bacterium]
MKRVFGLETEYGITVDGMADLDVVRESIAIVRSYTEHGAHLKWDYTGEDPHQDARGFRAPELRQDTDEAAYYELDKHRNLSFAEIKSDLVLSNGARFYNDHAHPEYSTPECATLKDIVAQDKAGERVLEECMRRRNSHLPDGQTCRLYKNNTDFQGHSYGCHDNFLMRREVPWEHIVRDIVSFLVTRQLFAGAGKLGVEGEDERTHSADFQLAQRSDFFEVLTSIDTMNRRPIVNTRDEPHADGDLYRRFHIIVGDANMSEWATAMKIGTTALVLELIEKGCAPRIALEDPILATRLVSRDQHWKWPVRRQDGTTMGALDVQREWLEAARRHCEPGEDTAWILREWEQVLRDLASDPMSTRDRCDWAAKRFLLETFREAENLDWSHPWLQALDLEYHDVSLENGLYYELVREGQMQRVVTEDVIKHAIFYPPDGTRAFFRGRAVAKFNDQITSLQWDALTFGANSDEMTIHLPHPAFDPQLDRLNALIRDARSVQELR